MINIIKSDLYKYKKSAIYPMHIIIPVLGALIFGFYFKHSNWTNINKLDIFINSIGIIFPLIISIVVSLGVTIEENGEFKNLLSSPYGKGKMIFSKILIFFIMGIISTEIVINIFYFIEGYNLVNSYNFFVIIGLILSISSIFNYILQTALNLKFGRNVAISVGVCQMLIVALFRTGLGDGIWMYSPSSWGMRISSIWVLNNMGYKNIAIGFKNILIILFILAFELLIFSIMYSKFEGREITE
ncbi:MAG: lantibiotic immunity ABC transporter MutG family permease subunit [Tissierellia bacterium]|nr:lantibiotic immunity ABC transporter MutG family permease subunit [Tissierellia bacterium]